MTVDYEFENSPNSDRIPASPLLRQHVQMVREQMFNRIIEAARSEAETRNIDTDRYKFDPETFCFVDEGSGD